MFSAGIVDPVCPSQVRLQVSGELGIGREGFLTEFTLEFLHVNKLYVVSEGFGHNETVGTLSKLRAGTVTRLVVGRQLGWSFEQLETYLTLDHWVTGYVSNIFRVIILHLTHILILGTVLFTDTVDTVAVLFQKVH